MIRGRLRGAAIFAAMAAAVVAPACSTKGADAHTVELLVERGFVPASLRIAAGDTVVFDNRTTRVQAVSTRSPDGGGELASGRLVAYDTWVLRLDQPGTYVFGVADDPLFTAVVEVAP